MRSGSSHRLAEPTYAPQNQDWVWIEALVDCPGAQGLYVYQGSPELAIQPGDILSVPFGAQQVGAIALRLLQTPPVDLDPSQIRPVEEVVCRGFFAPHYWVLLQRTAQYYQTPLIQVIRTALPPGLLGKSQQRIRLQRDRIPPGAEAFVSTSAQAILNLLQASKTGDYTRQYLQQQVKGARSALRQLQQRGWITSYLEPPAAIQPKTQQAVFITNTADLSASDLTPRQREVMGVLQRRGGDLWLTEALQLCRTSSATLKALAQKGYLMIESREMLRTESGRSQLHDQPKLLTPAQTQALDSLNQLSGFTVALLHGVTGSGKTEVYLQAIAPLLDQGQSVLVLVPEIGLTPQLTDRFRARFGRKVCVYHSALSDGERYDTWRQMLSGQPQVVIGTRSAVFAPLPQLGLIILDEEHDGSFKQDRPAPCYHARTVARWRAELEDCPLLLGSATPSLETWLEVQEESEPEGSRSSTVPTTYRLPSRALYLSLPERVHARPIPPIQVVDLRQEFQSGNRSIFSRPLQIALEEMKAKGQQGLLFIHRRGHSTFVSCRACGYVVECPHCDVSLAYHQPYADVDPTLRCHYCNYGRSHPTECPECRSPYLKNFGSGTQRVVHAIAQQFPDLSCIRFDSDTTRTKGAHRALLSRFAQGEADLLVGTQMLTKGIDLPQVTLVGILAADGLLHMSDYRASERTFQTLVQVAGRAGRGDDPGRVILQTYNPEHPVIQAVQRQDYVAFSTEELSARQESQFPPYCRLIVLRLSSPDESAVQQAAEQLAAELRPAEDSEAPYQLLGPAPAQILRVARRYRWQILLKFPLETDDLPDFTALRSRCPSQVSLTVDIDPLNLM